MANSLITVYGGDFIEGSWGHFVPSTGILKLKSPKSRPFREQIPLADLSEIEIYTQETAGIGSAGGAMVGGVLLGPVGVLVGAALAARRTDVAFVATFKDGRRLLGKTDSGTFARFKGAIFNQETKLKQSHAKKEAEEATAAMEESASVSRAELLVQRYLEARAATTASRTIAPLVAPAHVAAPKSDVPTFGKRRP